MACLNRTAPLSKYDDGPSPLKEVSKARYLKRLRFWKEASRKDILYKFGMFRRSDGLLVGTIDFFIIQRLVFQCANIGYHVNNQFAGQGYGREGVKAIFKLAFKDLAIRRIEAGTNPDNLGAIKLAQRVGMKREGLRRNVYFNGKSWEDLVYFSITNKEKPLIKTDIRTLVNRRNY